MTMQYGINTLLFFSSIHIKRQRQWKMEGAMKLKAFLLKGPIQPTTEIKQSFRRTLFQKLKAKHSLSSLKLQQHVSSVLPFYLIFLPVRTHLPYSCISSSMQRISSSPYDVTEENVTRIIPRVGEVAAADARQTMPGSYSFEFFAPRSG